VKAKKFFNNLIFRGSSTVERLAVNSILQLPKEILDETSRDNGES